MAKKSVPEDFSFRPFRNLKKIIDAEAVLSPEPESAPAKTVCPDDDELFLIGMRGVREIKEFRQIPVRRKGYAPTLKKRPDAEKEALKTLEDISRGKRPIRLEDTQEYVEWTNSVDGYSATIAKRLHEGRFAVQDFLDLHGFTEGEADIQVEVFLRNALLNGLRCVKIIHGRGLKSPQGPVLKEVLVKWLSGRYRKNVIAFSTARQCDGGLGALYILLKQRRIKKN